MSRPSAQGTATFAQDAVVPRPEVGRYRVRWLTNGLVALAGVAVAVLGAVGGFETATTWGMILGGLLLTGAIGAATAWQRRTWLAPEPSLVLETDRFRILHKGEHLWVPWTDIGDITVTSRGAGLGKSTMVVFHLCPGATTALPRRRASLGDQMFSYGSNQLVYSRPSETPATAEVTLAAHNRWQHFRSRVRPQEKGRSAQPRVDNPPDR